MNWTDPTPTLARLQATSRSERATARAAYFATHAQAQQDAVDQLRLAQGQAIERMILAHHADEAGRRVEVQARAFLAWHDAGRPTYQPTRPLDQAVTLDDETPDPEIDPLRWLHLKRQACELMSGRLRLSADHEPDPPPPARPATAKGSATAAKVRACIAASDSIAQAARLARELGISRATFYRHKES